MTVWAQKYVFEFELNWQERDFKRFVWYNMVCYCSIDQHIHKHVFFPDIVLFNIIYLNISQLRIRKIDLKFLSWFTSSNDPFPFRLDLFNWEVLETWSMTFNAIVSNASNTWTTIVLLYALHFLHICMYTLHWIYINTKPPVIDNFRHSLFGFSNAKNNWLANMQTIEFFCCKIMLY